MWVIGSSITFNLADCPGYKDFSVLEMSFLFFVLGGTLFRYVGLLMSGLSGLVINMSGGFSSLCWSRWSVWMYVCCWFSAWSRLVVVRSHIGPRSGSIFINLFILFLFIVCVG